MHSSEPFDLLVQFRRVASSAVCAESVSASAARFGVICCWQPAQPAGTVHMGRCLLGLGDVAVYMADRIKDPIRRLSYRTEAKSWYEKSLRVWRAIPNRSVISPSEFDVGDPAQVKSHLADCKPILAKRKISRGSRPGSAAKASSIAEARRNLCQQVRESGEPASKHRGSSSRSITNRKRLHSALGYRSTEEFEQQRKRESLVGCMRQRNAYDETTGGTAFTSLATIVAFIFIRLLFSDCSRA